LSDWRERTGDDAMPLGFQSGGWIDHEVWDEACDPSLPEGVIALQGRDGLWWRYPLAEFPAEETREWSAGE
jgi:hypothetical protein